MTQLSPVLQLTDQVAMPALGLGVGAVEESTGKAVVSVEVALRTGYRLIDTAAVYGNEGEVAEGLHRSGVPRDEVFLTTKLWIDDYGYEPALRAFEASLRQLRTDRVDLYLLHQPLPAHFDATLDAYRALETLLAQGRVGAIGVCNFTEQHLNDLAARTEVTPAVNQVELHPYFVQPALQQAHRATGTVTQAWSPIGGATSWNSSAGPRPSPLQDPVVTTLADELSRTPAQVVLRWHLDSGRSAVAKSWRPERVRENLDILDFSLTPSQLGALDALDTGARSGPDPDAPR